MTQSVTTKATIRNSVPTIQCRVQKHAPEARKMSVAAIGGDSNSLSHCTVHCMEVC